ncbi:hypothetical protein, variant [Fonticula alba]|nr:hypothetical protein, variant [Fonticula alba]KCV71372.1 hypothetical protein, variant [Fonticula alba]|eukprot:XP_009494494.1 hypothetical protein, variant [Fonticula alba]
MSHAPAVPASSPPLQPSPPPPPSASSSSSGSLSLVHHQHPPGALFLNPQSAAATPAAADGSGIPDPHSLRANFWRTSPTGSFPSLFLQPPANAPAATPAASAAATAALTMGETLEGARRGIFFGFRSRSSSTGATSAAFPGTGPGSPAPGGTSAAQPLSQVPYRYSATPAAVAASALHEDVILESRMDPPASGGLAAFGDAAPAVGGSRPRSRSGISVHTATSPTPESDGGSSSSLPFGDLLTGVGLSSASTTGPPSSKSVPASPRGTRTLLFSRKSTSPDMPPCVDATGAMDSMHGRSRQSLSNRVTAEMLSQWLPMGEAPAPGDLGDSASRPASQPPSPTVSLVGGVSRSAATTPPADGIPKSRREKFLHLLEQPTVELAKLRELSWNGIPNDLRATVWQLLMGYLPVNRARREEARQQKRREYFAAVADYWHDDSSLHGDTPSTTDSDSLHQIRLDIPRTDPNIPLYQHPIIQRSLERSLYIWTIRHPASGYVQGINDLLMPFFMVFLSSYIGQNALDCDPAEVPAEILAATEADSFWCLSRLLDGNQDSYTHGQPGILRQVNRLEDLIIRLDGTLHRHIINEGIAFIQFAFRWMNCLLMREMCLGNTIRMWDTYIAEGIDACVTFHLYVCAAFLMRFEQQIKSMDFQGIMLFIQSPPSATEWSRTDVELLLAEAFVLKSLFHNSPKHLATGAAAGGNA